MNDTHDTTCGGFSITPFITISTTVINLYDSMLLLLSVRNTPPARLLRQVAFSSMATTDPSQLFQGPGAEALRNQSCGGACTRCVMVAQA